MTEEITLVQQCWENMIEYLDDIRRAMVEFIQSLTESALKPPSWDRKISYNAVYWKIIDTRSLDIDFMVSSFGSNEKSYYHKIDR